MNGVTHVAWVRLPLVVRPSCCALEQGCHRQTQHPAFDWLLLPRCRSLDVSNCPNITNKSLYLLAKYQATQGLSSRHTQSQQLSSTQQSSTQQQELQEAQGEAEEFLYGWASSSSEDEGDDDDDDSSSDGVDDMPGGQAEPDTTASAPAGESTAAVPHTAAQQQEVELEQAAGSGVVAGQGSVRPDTSSATTAAASVGRQMAALEIQASLFHRPAAQLLGAADAQAAAEQVQVTDAAEVPAAATAAAAEVGGLVELKLAGNRCARGCSVRFFRVCLCTWACSCASRCTRLCKHMGALKWTSPTRVHIFPGCLSLPE